MNKSNGTLSNIMLVDEITGEFKGYLTEKEIRQIDKNRTSCIDIENKRRYEKKKSEDIFKQYIDNYLGAFYFNYYNRIKSLKLEIQYLFRLIYLCTFLDFENNLRYGIANNKMLEKDLQEVLKLGERETRKTKNELLAKKILLTNGKKELSINKKYIIKGNIRKNSKVVNVRMFEKGIQELYEKATPKEHKKLALLIELLPYLNFKFNVICNNVKAENIKEIEPFNMTDICKKVGYSNTTKLKRDLLDLKVGGELVIAITETGEGKFIAINPRVYYKGTKIEDLYWLENIFKIKNK